MEYNITVTNKFSADIDEGDDPIELMNNKAKEKEAKKKEKLSEKENKNKQPEAQKTTGIKPQKSRVIKDVQQQAVKVQEVKKDQDKKPSQPRTGGGDRNVKFSGESREERNNRRNRDDGERTPRGQGESRSQRTPPGEPRESREFRNSNDAQRIDYAERRGRGGMRGMNRGRGGPRGRGGFDNRGKREFDRQSGSDKTGVKPVDKKDGAGSHNWGTHNDEIEESMNQENQDWGNEKPEADAPPAPTEIKEGEAPADGATTEEKPAEEESRELTLDEWKALRNTREKPQYNLRKAGEGEDLSRWKKMYALPRKKEGVDDDDEDEEDYDAAAEYPQRVGRQKRVVGIEIQFSDSRRGAGGRGRGGRGRGGDRGNTRGFGNRGGGGGPRDADARGSVSVPLDANPPPDQRSPRGGGRQSAPKVDDENDFPSLG